MLVGNANVFGKSSWWIRWNLGDLKCTLTDHRASGIFSIYILWVCTFLFLDKFGKFYLKKSSMSTICTSDNSFAVTHGNSATGLDMYVVYFVMEMTALGHWKLHRNNWRYLGPICWCVGYVWGMWACALRFFHFDRFCFSHAVIILLSIFQIVQESPYLTMDLLESCFPYALLRNAYNAVYKASAAEAWH